MQELIDFYNEMKIDYELTIKENHIYIRFWTGPMFEAPSLDKFSLDKNILYKYYKILNFTFNLTNDMLKLINETEY